MKRILTMILSLALLIAAANASAADLTLPTKLQRQIQHDGNGEKGDLTVTANADPEKYPFISAIQNAEYSILRNASGKQWHIVICQTEKDEQGNEVRQINKTELYRGEKNLYFRSDFLPNEVFEIPEEISFILPEAMKEGENPSLNSVFLALLNLNDSTKEKQDAAIEKYSRILDKWIDGFQGVPEQIRNEDGSILMKLNCVVPADEVRKEIAELVVTAAADPEMNEVFSQLMTDEQKAIYFNPDLGYYYAEALAGAAINGDIQYIRIKTALGETVSKELILPINPELTGYEILKVKNSGERLNWTLQGEKGIVQLNVPENIETILEGAEYQFGMRCIRVNNDKESEEPNIAVSVRIQKTSEISYDAEKERNHETVTYKAIVQRDTSLLPDGVEEADIDPYDDLSAELTLHYSGKNGPNAATTLEVGLSLKQGELDLNAKGKIKTTSAANWPFIPFSTENVLQPDKLTENEKAAALLQLLKNADQNIVRMESKASAE